MENELATVVPTMDDYLQESISLLRRQRQAMLLRDVSGARIIPDIKALQDRHVIGVVTESDIIREIALNKAAANREERLNPAGGVVETDLSPQGLKTLSDVMASQTELASVVLGIPTKLTGSMSQSSHTRQVVSETKVHEPENALPLKAVEIDPPELEPLEGEAPDSVIEGEVEDDDFDDD